MAGHIDPEVTGGPAGSDEHDEAGEDQEWSNCGEQAQAAHDPDFRKVVQDASDSPDARDQEDEAESEGWGGVRGYGIRRRKGDVGGTVLRVRISQHALKNGVEGEFGPGGRRGHTSGA